ncbi:MAG TPA: TIGR02206 family membrane protein [Solirubrobacteraceae bacterium]|nr:TIGR02206 family membrane protein [Solirubrobacteraceae bacterium]
MRQFSPPHLAALAVVVAASAASVWAARRNRDMTLYCRLLALLIFAAWAGEYAADAINGTYTAKYTLPLQLTDIISLTAVVALWTRKRLAVELLYFWSLSASLQALLTPDLGENFPSIYYFTYFVYHIGAVVAALMLVFGLRIYPRPRAAVKVFVITLAWAAVAGIGDVVTRGNYMYLRDKPIHGSLLNVMGPWPWYIVTTAALALAMLLVLQVIADQIRRHDPLADPLSAGMSSTPAAWRTYAGTPSERRAPSARTPWFRHRGSAGS